MWVYRPAGFLISLYEEFRKFLGFLTKLSRGMEPQVRFLASDVQLLSQAYHFLHLNQGNNLGLYVNRLPVLK